MSLPLSRNTTYAAGSQVKSADLDDIQDKIIDAHFGKVSIIAGALTGSEDDWAPAGIEGAQVIRVTASGVVQVSGIDAGASQVDGRVLTLVKLGANTVQLLHDDSGSAAENRFLLPGGNDINFGAAASDDSITFMYDATSQRWRVISLVLG